MRLRTVIALALGVAVSGAAFFAFPWLRGDRSRETVPQPSRRPLPPPPPAPKPEAPSIEATQTSILLDGVKVCELPALEEQFRVGAGTACKGDPEPYHLEIGMLTAELARRWPDGGVSEARVDFRLHEETPYRLVVELIFSLGENFGRIRISTPASDAGPALSADFELPTGGGPPGAPRPVNWVTLFVVSDGISVKLGGKNVGPGCQLGATGLTVSRNVDYDYRELATCIGTLLAGNSDVFTDDAYLTANPNVPIRTILRAVSVLRCGSDTCLFGGAPPRQSIFSNVCFKVPRNEAGPMALPTAGAAR